jgi:hypothetical protein
LGLGAGAGVAGVEESDAVAVLAEPALEELVVEPEVRLSFL